MSDGGQIRWTCPECGGPPIDFRIEMNPPEMECGQWVVRIDTRTARLGIAAHRKQHD